LGSYLYKINHVETGKIAKKFCINEEIRADVTQGISYAIPSGIFFIPFSILKYKVQNIQKFDFICCLYWCKIWYLTLKAKFRLKVFRQQDDEEDIGV